MRILATSDIHCRVDTPHLVEELVGEALHQADVFVIAGDLTDTGRSEEAAELARQLSQVRIPVIAILGNHDHQTGKPDEIAKMLVDSGVHMLDCSFWVVGDVSFVGAKGFCGGFGDNLVQPFGELALKTFIGTSIEETVRLDEALAQVTTPKTMAILHYAPIRETLAGEAPEIFAFMGTSRLGKVIDQHGANLIVHGHSHHGFPEGRTPGNIPVHNICHFVLERYTGVPYCMFEL